MAAHGIYKWRPRQESNLHLALRRRPFYPLNYGGGVGVIVSAAVRGGRGRLLLFL